jgi:hypothetical protein
MPSQMIEDGIETSWIDRVIACYEAGGSDVEVCKVLKSTIPKFNELYRKDAKFAELVDYGRMMSHAWWMEQARMGLKDKSMNVPLWSFVMKNRFGWADKTENVERLPDHMADLDSVKAKLMEVLPGLLKHLNPSATESQILKELKVVK